MKTPLGTEVDIGAGHIVLDGFKRSAKGAQHPPPLLGPCLLWPRSPISATAELLLIFVSSVLAKRISEMTCFVSSATWNLNSVTQHCAFNSQNYSIKFYLKWLKIAAELKQRFKWRFAVKWRWCNMFCANEHLSWHLSSTWFKWSWCNPTSEFLLRCAVQ